MTLRGGRGGGGNNFEININAVDTQSFAAALARNPEALVSVLVSAASHKPNVAAALRRALS